MPQKSVFENKGTFFFFFFFFSLGILHEPKSRENPLKKGDFKVEGDRGAEDCDLPVPPPP